MRTRVDVALLAQNQSLLVSTDKGADLQLRLQKTVEGLSVVAIIYYSVSLAVYLLYQFASVFGVSKGNLTATVALSNLALVWWALSRIRACME